MRQSFRQPAHAKQLRAQLAKAASVRERVDRMNALSFNVRYSDFEEATRLAYEALVLAQEAEYEQGVADSATNLSWFALDRTEYRESHAYALQALEIYERYGESWGQAAALDRIGRLHLYWGNYAESLDTHLQQLKLANADGHTFEKAIALNSLGNLYARLQTSETASTYYKMAEREFVLIGDKRREYVTRINQSICSIQLGHYDAAIGRTQMVLENVRRDGSKHLEARCLNILGRAYVQSGQTDKARVVLAAHLQLADEIGDRQQQLETLLNLAKLAIDAGEFDYSAENLQQALSLAVQHNMRAHQYRAHQLYARHFERQSRFEEALEQFKQFQVLKDSVFYEENERKFRDLESVHQAQLAQQKASELELLVNERTQELAALNDELRQLAEREATTSQLKSRIISTVTHEFRTPLTVINGSVDLLFRFENRMDAAKKQSIEQRIRGAVRELDELLRDVTISDSEVLVCNQRPWTGAKLFQQLVDDVSTQVPAERLEFEQHDTGSTQLLVDYGLLLQALLYLVDNALLYSADDTRVVVSMQTQTQLTLAVRDWGIGLLEADKPRIWDALYRGQNVDTQRGLGLGLSNAQRIVVALGGRVSAESDGPFQGSTFTIHLPIPKSKPAT